VLTKVEILADWPEPCRTTLGSVSLHTCESNGRAGIRCQDGIDVIEEEVSQDRVVRSIGLFATL
jgi:hypothetical protein